MKSIFVFTFLALFSAVVCRPDDKYTTKYDNIDIEEILKSERLLNNYFKCLMTGEACTTEGKELRANLPDAFETGCSKCSEKQREMTKRVLIFLIDNKQDMYKQLEATYDPEGLYKKKYKNQLESAGIKLLRK